MKILIIGDYFLADMGYPRVSLAKAWQQAGHTVQVLTSNRYFPFHHYDQSVKRLIGDRIRPVGRRHEHGILVERKPVVLELFARVLFWGINERVAVYQPDVIVVFGVSSFSAIQVALLKQGSRIKCQIIMVDSHLPSELVAGNQLLKQVFYGWFRLAFSNLVSQQTDKFVATQDETIRIIQETYGISQPVTLIPNGTDTQLFRKDLKQRKIVRHNLNINDRTLVVIYTGKIIPEKGVDILCRAFHILSQKYRDTALLLVGDGSQEYQEICTRGLGKETLSRIRFVGAKPREKLYKYYSAADVAVWPLQESLAMNDAASCELPFVANHTLGDKTRISRDNALLYTKGDHFDLANKLEIMYSDAALRKAMGKRGRSLMATQLSWDALAQQYLN